MIFFFFVQIISFYEKFDFDVWLMEIVTALVILSFGRKFSTNPAFIESRISVLICGKWTVLFYIFEWVYRYHFLLVGLFLCVGNGIEILI